MGKRKSDKPELEPAVSSPESVSEPAAAGAAGAPDEALSLSADTASVDASGAAGTSLVLFAPPRPEEPKATIEEAEVVVDEPAPAKPRIVRRFGLAQLAAGIGVAAIGGILAGGIAISALQAGDSVQSPAAPAVALRAAVQPSPEEQRLAELTAQVARLTTKLDATTGSMDRQFASFTTRFDRVEKQQADQGGTLTRLDSAVSGISQRSAAVVPAAAPSNEITGSIAPLRRETQQTERLDDWVLVDVYRGRALVDGRRFGVFEIEPGSTLPGAGQVRSIEQQDGRWVVVTRRGIITSALEDRERRRF